ncbi:hypothetical protein JTP77_042235, partial [Streptomyces sp. S9]|nr:hypothetical protein [Streptomyces sp. S9]
MTSSSHSTDRLSDDGRPYDGLILGASLATLDAGAGYGEIADAALAWRDGRIAWLGPRAQLPA